MVLPTPAIIVYTSSTGGSRVHEATLRVLNLLKAHVAEHQIRVEYMDIELTESKRDLRQLIWDDTQLKGTWPLVYGRQTFLGTVEELERLNERKQLGLALQCLQKLI